MNATRSSTVGEFDYLEGERSGRMRVEGFAPRELQRIGDWFRILELGREVGYAKPPRPALDTRSSRGFHTPVLPLVFLSVFLVPVVVVTVLSLAGFLPDKGGIWIAGVIVAPMLIAGIVLTSTRLRWYLRLRARVAETGERMPYGLGLAD